MPRDGSGVYHRPVGTDAVTDTSIESTKYNTNVADVEQDLNTPRPIVAGGTGGSNATAALTNLLAEFAKQTVTNYSSMTFQPGSFYSAGSATGAPVAGHAFAGICYVSDASNMFLEARDQDDSVQPGHVWVRQMKAGVWSAWVNRDFDATTYVAKAGDTMTGLLTLSADPSTALQAVTKQYADAGLNARVLDTGDTMTGPLVLPGNPTLALQATPKQYVDSAPNAVRYDTAQGLTAPQQAQARANIAVVGNDAMPASSNIIVNGGMEIAQDPGNTLLTIPNGTSLTVADCWRVGYNHTAATAVIKAQQQWTGGAALGGIGCQYLLQTTCPTALSAPVAGDFAYNYTPIEGYRIENLEWGTAQAQAVTLGFWVYCSVTGTMCASLRNAGANRSYIVPFTINNPNTWEYKTATIPGDTVGVWGNSNASALLLGFTWVAGATYQAPAANSWVAGNFLAVAGQSNFLAIPGNQVNITGVALYAGSLLLPLNTGNLIRRYHDELLLSQRYYYKFSGGAWVSNGMIRATNTGSYHQTILPVPMRQAPSLIFSGIQVFSADSGVTPSSLSAGTFSNVYNTSCIYTATHPALGAAGAAAMINTQSGSFAFDARM
jgi:hypothetical protein